MYWRKSESNLDSSTTEDTDSCHEFLISFDDSSIS